jgi:hypothetical protein
MTTARILEDYTRDEVRREVLIWSGRDLSVAQFYIWLPYCLIPEPKALYTKRDVKKFLFVSQQLKRIRSLETAKQKLVQRIENHPEEFEL